MAFIHNKPVGDRQSYIISRVVNPYSFFTDPDPDPELDVGGQYGSKSGSGSKSNTDPGLK
jgi:hypothetical protein